MSRQRRICLKEQIAKIAIRRNQVYTPKKERAIPYVNGGVVRWGCSCSRTLV